MIVDRMCTTDMSRYIYSQIHCSRQQDTARRATVSCICTCPLLLILQSLVRAKLEHSNNRHQHYIEPQQSWPTAEPLFQY